MLQELSSHEKKLSDSDRAIVATKLPRIVRRLSTREEKATRLGRSECQGGPEILFQVFNALVININWHVTYPLQKTKSFFTLSNRELFLRRHQKDPITRLDAITRPDRRPRIKQKFCRQPSVEVSRSHKWSHKWSSGDCLLSGEMWTDNNDLRGSYTIQVC